MFTMQLVGVQPRRVRDGRRTRLVCEQCADLQRHRVCIDACGPVAYSIASHPRVLRCILHAFARVCECLRVRASACACERAHGHMFMRVCNGARCRFCTPSLHGAHRASVDASAARAPCPPCSSFNLYWPNDRFFELIRAGFKILDFDVDIISPGIPCRAGFIQCRTGRCRGNAQPEVVGCGARQGASSNGTGPTTSSCKCSCQWRCCCTTASATSGVPTCCG